MSCPESDDTCWKEKCPDHPYVACDDQCQALRDPQTKDELRRAYEHWASHGYLSGCSHGC